MLLCAYRDMKNLSQAQVSRVASRARALGEPTRVRIVEMLARGEQAVGQIAAALDTQQSTVSKHLQVLFQAGLVDRRREASKVIYSIASRNIVEWVRYLSASKLAHR